MDHIATPIASATSQTKKWAASLSVIAGLGILAVALLAPSLFSAEGLNHDIELQIRRATGLSATITGTAQFHLLPQPSVEITNIAMSDPSGALRIDADSLTGYLRFLPLLAGRFEIARASLTHPAMVIDLDGRPMTPDSAIGHAAETKSSDQENRASQYTRLGSVDLVSGSARLQSQSGHIDRLLEDVNMSIDWPNLGAAAEVTGKFKFREVPVELAAWFAQPLELIRGAESALTLSVGSSVANLSTSGTFAAGPHLQYRGRIEAKITSLRQLAELTGHSFPRHGRFADLKIKCDANFMAKTAALSNLRLQMDGNDYEGTIAIQTGDAKPLVSGTVATNYLDLAPFLAGLPEPLTKEHRWNPAPLDTADLGFADFDLRVSATRLRLAQIELRDSALSLITKTGGMDLTLAEATANHGKVKGRVSFAVQNGGLTLRATGNVKDLRLRPLPFDVDGHHELSGSVSGNLALDTTGRSIDDLMQNVAGRAQIDLDSGEITSLDLETLFGLGTSGKQKSMTEAEKNASLDGASVGLKITEGRAEIESGRLQTKGMHVTFGGGASLAERTFHLWAVTQEPPASDATTKANVPTRVTLTGSWDAPSLVFEPVKLPRAPAQILPLLDTKPNAVTSHAPGEQ
jgi:AsmA protein